MLFLEEHLYTLLQNKDHQGARCQHLLGGGGLIGYTCETCLGTGKSRSGLRVLQLVDQAWSDDLDGDPIRNTVSG